MAYLEIQKGYAYIKESYTENGRRRKRTLDKLGQIGRDITLEEAKQRRVRWNPPKKRYEVIVVDPPWRYDNKRPTDSTHRGDVSYLDMDYEQIRKLPIPKLAQKNSILWLWTTNAFMLEALELIKEWGFIQKTILTWKKNKMGLGTWLRGKTEHCILAIRGRPVVNLTNQTTIIEGKVREHSRKPEEFYKLVEGLCIGSKLDYFGREPRVGWDVYGNEYDKFSTNKN